MVGNSTSTLISPICFTQIPHRTNPLVMSEVLYAPNITKNLLFVSQFTKSNYVYLVYLFSWLLCEGSTNTTFGSPGGA